MPEKLLNELNTTWLVGSEKWPVCFSSVGGFCLEEEYLLLYLEVQPLMPDIDADSLAQQAVMLTNKLCYRKKQCPKLVREFKPSKEGIEGRSKQEIAQDQFQGNSDSVLIRGLIGEPVTVTEILANLAGPGWESMLLDRFLLKSLLITPVDEPTPTYSRIEEENLCRLVRGMNENYLPTSLEAMAGYVIQVRTFANVLFLAANEGIAGHIKPAPGPGQEFLRKQFASRDHTEYTLLFVLAVYQHYRLIDMIEELADDTEKLNENGQPLDSSLVDKLRKQRRKLAVHEVKYIINQPAFLTNYQQYYTGLRQGLNTEALAEKLRRSVAELDALLDAEKLRQTEAEQQEEKLQKERRKASELLLAMLAEAFALPYYLYNLLTHALHCNYAGYITLCVTVSVLLITGRKSGISLNRMKLFAKEHKSR